MAKSRMPWPEIAGRQPAVSQMLDVGARQIVDFPLVVLAVSLLVQWLAAWLADAFRSRMRPLKELEREDYGIVLTASLTLLGLIIAFSFSMAVSRYDQRKNYEEQEANAIGTAYVRANLLPSADAVKVRALLSSYVTQRMLFYKADNDQQLQQVNDQITRLQHELWSAVAAIATAQPTPVMALVLAAVNDVLNSQGNTQAAFWNRIPVAAWILMIVISIFCNLLVGFGVRSRNVFLLLILPIVLSVSFFLIADIDSPRRGVIDVLPQNLARLAESLGRQ